MNPTCAVSEQVYLYLKSMAKDLTSLSIWFYITTAQSQLEPEMCDVIMKLLKVHISQT
jgi:hypothetical protein